MLQLHKDQSFSHISWASIAQALGSSIAILRTEIFPHDEVIEQSLSNVYIDMSLTTVYGKGICTYPIYTWTLLCAGYPYGSVKAVRVLVASVNGVRCVELFSHLTRRGRASAHRVIVLYCKGGLWHSLRVPG